MEHRPNNRGADEYFVKRRHLELPELKEAAADFNRRDPVHQTRPYIFEEPVPESPRAELHVSHLKHDTDQAGLWGIQRDGGFRGTIPRGSEQLQWWSLAVKVEDLVSAETRLLDQNFPLRNEDQVPGHHTEGQVLGKFASSPAFLQTSRLGSYRFTLSVDEVLEAYSQQFCRGTRPVMRVFETVLYKQEVMYVVLVHSPANQSYREYPLLRDHPDAVCDYRNGRFMWRCQAMCETHRYQLVQRPDRQQVEAVELPKSDVRFYVWDHVAVALHLEDGQVLRFADVALRQSLTFCDRAEGRYHHSFDLIEEADEVVCDLWPWYQAPLQKERSLQEALAVQGLGSRRSRRPAPRSSPLSTLIIGDSIVEDVTLSGGRTLWFPKATVQDITVQLPDIMRSHPEVDIVVIHAGAYDVKKQESELLKRDFLQLFQAVTRLHHNIFISGPIACGGGSGGWERFSRLLSLHNWLSSVCGDHDLGFIDNFNLFWKRWILFRADGLHLSNVGRLLFSDNVSYVTTLSTAPWIDFSSALSKTNAHGGEEG